MQDHIPKVKVRPPLSSAASCFLSLSLSLSRSLSFSPLPLLPAQPSRGRSAWLLPWLQPDRGGGSLGESRGLAGPSRPPAAPCALTLPLSPTSTLTANPHCQHLPTPPPPHPCPPPLKPAQDFFAKECWAHHPKPHADYLEDRRRQDEAYEAERARLIPGM